MRAALTRPWYLASIALALTAIAVDMASKRAAGVGMVGMANAAAARAEGVPLDVIESMRHQAKAAAWRADALGFIGLCVAAAAGACLFVSIQKDESRWDVIPVALLLCYIALKLLQV
jgi:hypothetical protein